MVTTSSVLLQRITEGLRRAEEHRLIDEKQNADYAYARAYGYLRGLLSNLVRDLQDEEVAQ